MAAANIAAAGQSRHWVGIWMSVVEAKMAQERAQEKEGGKREARRGEEVTQNTFDRRPCDA